MAAVAGDSQHVPARQRRYATRTALKAACEVDSPLDAELAASPGASRRSASRSLASTSDAARHAEVPVRQ